MLQMHKIEFSYNLNNSRMQYILNKKVKKITKCDNVITIFTIV